MKSRYRATVSGTFVCTFDLDVSDPTAAKAFFEDHKGHLLTDPDTKIVLNSSAVSDDAGHVKIEKSTLKE